MAAVIHLTIISNPFEPWRDRTSRAIEHRPGITLSECIQQVGRTLRRLDGYRRLVTINGISATAADQPLAPGDTVMVHHVPAGPAAAAAPATGMLAGGAAISWGNIAITAAAAFFIGTVIQALTPSPKYDIPNIDDTFDSSATYGWDTGANQVNEGVALPILYGTRRITPPVLAHHVAYDDLGNELLSILLGIAEGGQGARAGGTDQLAIAQVDDSDAVYINGAHHLSYLAPGINAAANDLNTNRCINGTASASSVGGVRAASCAFDQNTATFWLANNVQTGWLQYNLGTGVRIKATGYTIHGHPGNQVAMPPASWDFQGSNDGTNWTTLDSQSGQNTLNPVSYEVTNTTFYQYYQLANIVSYSGVGSLCCAEFSIYGEQQVTPEIDITFREGGFDQAVITDFANTYCNISVGKTVDIDWFTFPTGPGAGATILGLHLSFPNGLYSLNASSGAVEIETVQLAAEYRTVSNDGTTGSWTAFTGAPWTISANSTSAYRVSKQQTGLSAYRYDVRVKFNTTPAFGRFHINRCVWDYLQEGVTDDFIYPCTALLALTMKATNVLSGGFPQIEAIASRPYVLVMIADDWVAKPATNPAWICYDLLINPHYGGSVAPTRLLLSEFQDWADFCDNMRTFNAWESATVYLVGDIVRPVAGGNGYHYEVIAKSGTGTSAASEPTWPTTPGETIIDNAGANQLTWACRLNHVTCNLYYDTAQPLRDSLAYASQIGRASIIMRGTSFGVVIDRQTTPVQLFTAGNIVGGSFREEFTSRKDLLNAVEINYFDADRDYSRQIVTIASPDYDDTDFDPNVSQVTLYGCVDRNQAEAHGRFLLACNQYLRRLITFEADIDAIACQVGDVVQVQHPVPQWGLGGGRTVSATSDSIILDKPITRHPSTTYTVLVRHADDTLETAELEPVTSETTSATLTLKTGTSWTSVPAADTVYAVGISGSETKSFRVVRISRSQAQTRRITLIEYNALVYA